MTKQYPKSCWIKRSFSLLLAFFLLAGALVLPLDGQAATKKYGRIHSDNTNFGTAAGSNYLFRLPKDWVVEILGQETINEAPWYKVVAQNPNDLARTYEGYILSGYLTEMTDAEATAWEQNPLQPTTGNVVNQPPAVDANAAAAIQEEQAAYASTLAGSSNVQVYTVGTITSGGTNLRQKPWGAVITKLNRGTVLQVFEIPTGYTENDWYGVRYGEQYGYIQAPFFTLNTGATLPTPSAPQATSIPNSQNAQGYVMVTKGGANLRDGINGKTLTQLKRNTVLPYVSKPAYASGYTWYEVITADGVRGYLRSDVATVTDAGSGGGNVLIPTAAPDITTIYGTVTVTKSNSNVRQTPGGKSFTQVAKGSVLSYYAAPLSSGGHTWYYVQIPDGRFGYMRNDVVSASPNVVTPTATPVPGTPTATPVPGTPTATPVPGVVTPTPVPGTGYGTITLIKNNVNLRRTPNGLSLTQLKRNTTHNVLGAPVPSGKYTWYLISASGHTGYIRGDMVQYSGGSGGVGPIVTQPPTSTSGYLKITKPAVNLRDAAAGKTIGRVDRNTIWPITGAGVQAKGYVWYPIIAKGQRGYVRGDMCYQLSPSEVEDYLNGGGGSVSPTTAPTTPPVSPTGQYVLTTVDNVELRVLASSSAITLDIINKNVAMPYTLATTIAGETWYNVTYVNMGHPYLLWVNGAKVKIITAAEYQQWLNNNNIATPNPGATATPTPTVTSGPIEATYDILRRGSTGEEVRRLQAALKEKGYFTDTISGVYGTTTYNAVKAYQRAVNLKVDGTAGPNTLHSLYGTVPPGTTNPGDNTGDFVMYPVEKSDWYTGDINSVWARGLTAQVKDVKTGITFSLKRIYGGYHADAEPLTTADTAKLCQAYGVSTPTQILSSMAKRPIWVTIGGRTFAASLYGTPHGDDNLLNNNFVGQLCVHFTNSKGHDSGIVSATHKKAIEEAYNAAPIKK